MVIIPIWCLTLQILHLIFACFSYIQDDDYGNVLGGFVIFGRLLEDNG